MTTTKHILTFLLCLFCISCTTMTKNSNPGPTNPAAEERAERNGPSAQYQLAMDYQKGTNGTPQNYSRALFWFNQAAQAGNAEAQDELGNIYAKGKIVTRNYQTALYWYQKSAAQNLASGQYHLGTMYQKGRGTAQNSAQAKYWFDRAIGQGYDPNNKKPASFWR